MKPAYPYFGSKAAIAPVLWEAFGVDCPNFVDPFCGSASVLLARPRAGKIETLNDAHAFIPNFLRAVRSAPDAVAEHAEWPVSEIDMHARHTALLAMVDEAFVERLRADPDYFDAKVAGWWVWGASIWIGSGWCDDSHRNGATSQRPALSHGGSGVFRGEHRRRPVLAGQGSEGRPHYGVGIFGSRLPHLIGPHNGRKLSAQLPSLQGSDGSGVGYGRGIFASGRREDLRGYFAALAQRLALVRITCGDWARVCTPAVTISHGLTAVLLDPPYGAARTANLYAKDSTTVAAEARAWAVEHGADPHYRIALCGYAGEHEMPDGWREHAWKTNGGYGNRDKENANASKERIWFSPHCLGGEMDAGPLFAAGASI